MQKIKYCSSCGKTFTDLKISFCPYDGSNLAAFEAAKEPQPSQSPASPPKDTQKAFGANGFIKTWKGLTANTKAALIAIVGITLWTAGFWGFWGIFSNASIKVTNNTNKTAVPTATPATVSVSSASPVSQATAAPAAVEGNIAKGAQIYKRIESRTGLPVMFGWRAQKMSLLIPQSDWQKMTKQDQINLTYYAENLVREIRLKPTAYAQKWASYYKRTEQLERGGEYDGLYESSYIEQVSRLCDTCWDIKTGVVKRDGFYDENTPVSGADVQGFRRTVSN